MGSRDSVTVGADFIGADGVYDPPFASATLMLVFDISMSRS